MFETALHLNLCKLFFAKITLVMIVGGILINVFETYLPIWVVKIYKYGKFSSQEESSFIKPLEVPKSYFRHFYLSSAFIYAPLVLYEVVAVLVLQNEVNGWLKSFLNFACGYERTATVPALRVLIAVVLLVLQVFRRFYDTHFVSVFSKNAVMNMSHYLIGMAYYPATFIIILSEAPRFARGSSVSKSIHLSDFGVLEFSAIVLFLWAWYHQHVATVILGNVRKNKKGVVVSQSYKIPEGDWFEYLSSPHSTAEIVMYTAVTLLLFNNSGWWFVYAWVVSNQVETIMLSHWWYQKQFKDFPTNRKALIPFVY